MKRSNFLSLNATDFLKGFVMVIITALLTGIYQLLTNGGTLDWITLKPVLLSAVAAGLGYIIKNYLTNSQGEVFRTENSDLALYVKAKQPIAKIILIGLILSGIGITASAQPTFKGFFKPVKQTEFFSSLKGTAEENTGNGVLWTFRPHVEVTSGIAIYNPDPEIKAYEGKTFSGTGVGISLSKYVESDGSPFNNFGINAMAYFNWSVNDVSQTRLCPALSVTFMKWFSLGAGYLTGPSEGRTWAQRIMPMTGLQYNF
jgi:hypothetical protein